MKIINKEQLLKAPAGTVYKRYIPEIMNDELHVKVEDNCYLSFIPMWDYDKETNSHTNNLNTQTDYNKNDLFVVFNQTEIKKINDCLKFALTK